jgi:hypothetical protein
MLGRITLVFLVGAVLLVPTVGCGNKANDKQPRIEGKEDPNVEKFKMKVNGGVEKKQGGAPIN